METAAGNWPHDRFRSWRNPTSFLGCAHRFNTPQSVDAVQPVISVDDRFRLVFDGRLDNREQLCQLIDRQYDETITDEDLLADAWQAFGPAIGQHLIGDFAIAVLNAVTHDAFLIRDQMGIRPLFYAENPEYVAFASAQPVLMALPWVDQSPDEQWLADFLTITNASKSRCYQRGVSALPPAHHAEITRNTIRTRQYFTFRNDGDMPARSDEAYVRGFKELLFQAVQCRLRRYGPLATEMSGGLDSTSVAAIAATLEPETELQAYSHLMPDENLGEVFPFSDERDFVKIATSHYRNIRHHPIYSRGRGIVSSLRRAMRAHGGPQHFDITVFGDETFEKLQASDTRSILSGFGGDEAASSHGAGIYEDLIGRKAWRDVWREIQTEDGLLIRKLVKLFAMRFLTRRYLRGYRRRRYQPPNPFLELGWLKENGYPARQTDNPDRLNCGTMRERELYAVTSVGAALRIRDSAIGAASYGVDYRYPMLDIRLIQYCLDLPPQQKRRDGVQRRMLRLATQGILPDPLRLRSDKTGATVPTAHMRVYNDQAMLGNLADTPIGTGNNLRLRDLSSFHCHLVPGRKDRPIGATAKLPFQIFFNGLQHILSDG